MPSHSQTSTTGGNIYFNINGTQYTITPTQLSQLIANNFLTINQSGSSDIVQTNPTGLNTLGPTTVSNLTVTGNLNLTNATLSSSETFNNENIIMNGTSVITQGVSNTGTNQFNTSSFVGPLTVSNGLTLSSNITANCTSITPTIYHTFMV
jgi:hypothetical protein